MMQTMQNETSGCCELNNDRLSELPGDILLSILSYLPLKDVARTSVVSHKWQHMWRYVPILQFEDQKAPLSCPTQQEKTEFVSLVNHVLHKHLASHIDEFKIKFSLDISSAQDHIDEWVKFALSKHVKMLHIDLKRIGSSFAALCTLNNDFVNINLALTLLTLRYVNVTREQVQNLLRCCPVLDELCIGHSDIVTDLSISGSSLPLKYLRISFCRTLKTLDISAPKLLSFYYEGSPTTLRVICAPLLSKVTIVMQHAYPVWFAFDSLSNYFSQLEEFDLGINLCEEANLIIKHVPALPKLKHLRLRIIMGCHLSCLGWAPLIEACPVLEKLSLDISSSWYHIPKKESKREGGHLKSLKTLELRVRAIGEIDLELISYVFENAIMLEDVIVLPYERSYDWSTSIPKAEFVEVEKLLPPGVKFTHYN